MNFPNRHDERRRDAERRANDRAKLTPMAQLARLDERLGEGVGAERERKRLAKEIRKAQNREPSDN